MFSLQHSDELVLENPNLYLDEIWNDLILDCASMETNIIDFSSSKTELTNKQQSGLFGQRQSTSIDICKNNNNSNNGRVCHRDIERKRRREMSSLYVSLRNLLPLDHIKGKRSISDHMLEAVNYIKCMQKNIEELHSRRDKIKKLSDSLSGSRFRSSEGGDSSPRFVEVNIVHNGVEILIQSSDIGMSWVLGELLKRDINVISCVSTKANGRFFHKIMVEAIDLKSLDVAVLQEDLRSVILKSWPWKDEN